MKLGLGLIAAWPARRPIAAIAIALIAAVIAAIGVSRVRTDASLENLFGKDDPAAKAVVRVLNEFSSAEELLLLVTLTDSHQDTSHLLAFAQRLDEAVHNSPDVSPLVAGLLYRVDEQTRAFFEKVVAPAGLFYLDDAQFNSARQRLTRDEMSKQIRRNESMISAPGPAAGALSKALLQDPLRLHEFILSRLAAQRPIKTYQGGDAFISADGRSLLIRIPGTRPPSDLEFAKKLTSSIDTLANRVNADHLQIETSGAYAIAAASERAIRRDMIVSVITSVVCLQLLFVVAYRRPVRFFLLAFVPIAVGILYGFGIYSRISATLTPMTAVIGGILAGMGIDYSVYYLTQYHAIRASGRAPIDAASEMTATVGPALFAAWLTSVIGFVAICWSSVRALHDFALVGSLGLAGAFFGAMFILPALLMPHGRRASLSPNPSTYLRFDVVPLLSWINAKRALLVGASVIILIFCLISWIHRAPWLPVETDLTVMHPRPNAPLEAQAKIARAMRVSPDSLLVYLHADSSDQLLDLAHRADERLNSPASRAAGVAGTYGLATLLPDPKLVPARRTFTGPAEADRVVADFRAAVADSMFNAEAYEPYAIFLHNLLADPKAPTVQSLLPYRRLAETMLPRSAFTSDLQPTEAITLVFLSRPIEDRQTRDAAIESIRGVLADLPGATLTGLSVISYDSERTILRDLPRLVLVTVGAVIVYLVLHFRSALDPILATIPAIFSLACLFVFMRLTGQKLNMVNLVALPLLIGIDVDYGIFLTSMARLYRERSSRELATSLAPACHAVIVCSTSVILGFGSLIFTSVPAIRSLGWAVGMGVIACLVGCLFLLLPILLMWAGGKR